MMRKVQTTFIKLNQDWNAEPNDPSPVVADNGKDVFLNFFVNAFIFPEFSEEDQAIVKFSSCWRYRLGAPGEEGWYQGQCRFAQTAPAWGEFYEIRGEEMKQKDVLSWKILGCDEDKMRHYLFYMKDNTFECYAHNFKVFFERKNSLDSAGRSM